MKNKQDIPKALEEALWESEEKFRSVVDSVGVGIILTSPNMEVLFINNRMKQWFPKVDASKKPICYKSFNIPPRDDLCPHCAVWKTLKDGEIHETVINTPQGRDYKIVSSPIKDSHGRIVASVEIVEDITERKKAEEALRESEEKYRHISSVMSDIAYSCHRKNNDSYSINWVTGAAEKITGYSIDEIKTKRCWGFLVVEEDLPLFKKHAIGLSSGSSSSCEMRLRHKNGDIVWVASSAKCLQEPEGRGYRLYGGLMDITERKKTEEELKKSKEKLEAQAWGQQKTNEAIKLLYKELEAMNKKLQEVDLMKSDFVSHVSHELRTPLTTMREANAQLLEGLKGPLNEGQKRFLEISQKSVDRLSRIINNILDLSRLEAGKIKLERKSVDIITLAREIIDSLRPQADHKMIKLEDKLPASLPETFIDPDRIRQVFTNLLGNALKYTKDGGKIILTAEKKEDRLEVSIEDTGIGVPPEYLDKVFERFERVAKIPIPGIGGAGLGLSICKELLDLHKGSICVESTLGKGSKFTFSLPIYKETDFLRDYLGEQIQEAKRIHSFVSLIMINIENFSQLKRKWGVKTMAQVQNQLEDLISSYIRDPMDKVIRYKEDTLALVLIGTPKENGQAVEKRIKDAVGKQKFKAKDGEKPVKLSIKFKEVTYPVDAETEGELIERAKDIIG